MHKLTNWNARRAGAGITIYGKGPMGVAVRLVECARIDGGSGQPIRATLKDGTSVELAS